MQYSDAELRSLAARATPLNERRGLHFESEASESEINARLKKWRQTFSVEGDSRIFALRLAFDGLDIQTCRSALGCTRLAEDQPLPAWAKRFDAFLQDYAACADVSLPIHQDWYGPIADQAEELVPFWDLWVPLVTSATEELRDHAGRALNLLTEVALRCFQVHLLETLAQTAALPLALEFRRFVAQHDPHSMLRPAIKDAPPSRNLYCQYVRHLRDSGLLAFFQKYPVLARLMATIAGHWVEHVAEFARRAEDDRQSLAKLFNEGSDLGLVTHVSLGVSDPHCGRRTVVIPTFESGTRIVYKPRDLGIDEAYWSLTAWLTDQGSPLPLRTVTVLNRTTHGWVEFIEHLDCNDDDELSRYYMRIGMLLCMVYVLGASDFHLDNIIANGEQPVLVDLETMLQPLPRPWDARLPNSADERVAEVMHQSVLRTGLLPFWIVANPGKSYDVSGIAAEVQTDTGYLDIEWDAINSDQMQLVYRNVEQERDGKRPMLSGHVVSVQDHVVEMIDGFVAMYRFLIKQRDKLLAEDGPLALFNGVKLRCLLRMTKVYGQISNRRLHPEFLRDGADASIELERLARDFVAIEPNPGNEPPWGVYRAEAEALERLDIPYFNYHSNSTALMAADRVIAPNFFSQSGLDYVVARLRQMNELDLQTQLNFIGASFHARFAERPSESARKKSPDTSGLDHREVSPLSHEEFIAAAVAIGDEIRNSAIRGADGGATWISMSFDPLAERMKLLPMLDNLYDGRIGVAFFLAALEHVTGGAGFRDLALAALMPLRKTLRQSIPPLTGRNTLGGAAGLGSQIYGFVRVAEWLKEDELLELARRAARWFIPRRIALDESLDVFGGAAGGLLGLLSLLAPGGNGMALEPAVACGEHLLQNRALAKTGHWAWKGSGRDKPLTGFGHGAAGIAYSLLRLSGATGELRFREAANEGIAYETAVYSTAARNWPDYRVDAQQTDDQMMVAWCNGATGIGLGRVGGLTLLDTHAIRDDIEHAVQTTREATLDDSDHLCCGNMGRIDFLLEVGKGLNRPELLAEAKQRATLLVRNAAQRGSYNLYAAAPGFTTSTSFFQGIAGIGYTLLRLTDPQRLPCALLWE